MQKYKGLTNLYLVHVHVWFDVSTVEGCNHSCWTSGFISALAVNVTQAQCFPGPATGPLCCSWGSRKAKELMKPTQYSECRFCCDWQKRSASNPGVSCSTWKKANLLSYK